MDKRKRIDKITHKKHWIGVLSRLISVCFIIILIVCWVNKKETTRTTNKTNVWKETMAPSSKPQITEKPVVPLQAPVTLEQYNDLLAINQDLVGMITIADTKISSYPVVIGVDNEYYLKHDIRKDESKQGSIYVDYLYDKLKIAQEFGRHTLIFGHNMKDDSMFGQVVEYKKKAFFDAHEYINFDNLYEKGKWKVFSVYVVDADKETIQRTFEQDSDYLAFLKSIQERSKFAVDVSLTTQDKIITLCTCSYETDNSRTIVHAVLVNE